MKIFLFLTMTTLLTGACAPPADSPVGPTPLRQPTFPSTPPAPTGPPFTVTISDGATPLYPGLGSVLVTVAKVSGVVTTEVPVSMAVSCAGRTVSRDIGFGSTSVPCDFPAPGSYSVQATVAGSAGFRATAGSSVVVAARPVERLDVFYAVTNSDSNGNEVTFSTRTMDAAARYRWNFGDGAAVETLLPYTPPHRFERGESDGGVERVVTVAVTDATGQTIGTGRVIGRW